ncbi:MAG: aspartyl protease family protein [Gemmatimonadota bacterium]
MRSSPPVTIALLAALALPSPAALAQDGRGGETPTPAAAAARATRPDEHPDLEGTRLLLAEAEARLASGDAAVALATFERATAELGKVLLYGEPDSDAWGDATRRAAAGAARAHLALGEPYLARLEAARALNVDPGDAGLRALLGTSFYREARFVEAEEAFAEALRLDPELAAAHLGKGLVDLSANRLASARERLERAYSLEGDPESLWFLARIALVERDYGSAARRLREYLDRARGLSPERRDEVRERARVYARLDDGRGSRFTSRVTRGQLRFDVARGDEVPLLPVRLNGRDPVYLIFDTGAQDHVLDLTYARELGLELSGPAGRIESALGAVERRLAVVDSLDLQGIGVRDVPFSVADLGALGFQGRRSYYVAGVLNPALLLRDFLVRVDFFRRTIELERYDTGGSNYLGRGAALRRVSVPFRFNADATGMIVQAELAGSRGHPLLVDTGASDVYLSALVGRVLDLDPLAVRIGLGDYRKDRLRAHFLRDLGPVEEGELPGSGVVLEGILGYPFFRDMRLVLDYYHGLLLIEN